MTSFSTLDALEIVYVPLVNLLGVMFIKLFEQIGWVDISKLPLRGLALTMIALKWISSVIGYIIVNSSVYDNISDTLYSIIVCLLLPIIGPFLLVKNLDENRDFFRS